MASQDLLPSPGGKLDGRDPAQQRLRPFSPHRHPAAVLLTAVVLVFVLPLWVPVKPVYGISASYLAGFNNSAAILGAIALSVAVLSLASLAQRRHPPTQHVPVTDGPLTWHFAAAVIACSSVILGSAGALVTAAHQRYLGDAGYIIEQASAWSDTGRKLYSQIEFAYGPLLLLPEIWLSRLAHLDMTRAYFAVLVLESALGLAMVAYLLNELPIRPPLRQIALVLFALGAITPHLGLNYTFFRFASPLALFLFATRNRNSPWKSAALLAVSVALECAISPELTFALAAGCIAYAGLRTWQHGRVWLITGIVPLAVLAALLLGVGRDYLRMVSTFSQGVYNLPIGPYPHILILLFALVWLVPIYLGRSLLLTRPESARILGLYAVALAMLPAALRRCDPLHVFFNGIGIFVLSLVAASHAPRRTRIAWITCLALLVLWEHRVNEGLFTWRNAYTVQRIVLPNTPASLRPVIMAVTALPDRNALTILRQPPEPDQIPDIASLNRLVGNEPIATPLEIPPVVETALKDSHHYVPLYHAFGVDMMDDAAEQSCIQELQSFGWLLLPTDRKLSDYQQLPGNIGPIQGIRMYFRLRNPVLFVPGNIFEGAIARNWTPVQAFGPYTLYRRSGTP